MGNFPEYYYWFLGLLLVGIFFIINYLREKKRSDALRLTAQSLGLNFEKKSNPDIVRRFSHLHLFSQGRAKKIMNRVYGKMNEIDTMVFGYRYRVGSGEDSKTRSQTVASFSTDKMKLPGFELRPEKLFHKIGGVFGYQDIDFDTHADFSKSYLLRGSDEAKIRNIFSPAILSFFEQHKGLCVEAQGDTLLCYRQSKRVKPDEIWSFLEEGKKILRLFYSE